MLQHIRAVFQFCHTVQLNGEARQGCPPSPVLSNVFLEKIMPKTLTHQHPSFDTCGLLTTSICWETAKNSNNSLKDWKKQLLDAAWKSAAIKAKSSSTSSRPSINIWMNGGAQEEVDQFKYFVGSIQTKDGTSKRKVKIRLAQAYSAISKPAIRSLKC